MAPRSVRACWGDLSCTVTAGNAPGITDGAAATIVASERTVERYGLKPLARIIGDAQAEVEPKWLFRSATS